MRGEARAYYNEIDPYAAQWLRNLIAGGHIAPGDVDERSIVDVRPSDLEGYAQCHFFAGIGVWSYALRLAGWADRRPVWTGSCPCQPFSAAGRRGGVDDERHLWPHWHHLIRECGPDVVFGEQVASKDGLGWLDLVCADLEGESYAVGAVDTCSAGHGAPHIRQRLRFVAERGVGLADAHDAGLEGRQLSAERAGERPAGACRVASGLADGLSLGRQGLFGEGGPGLDSGPHHERTQSGPRLGVEDGRMADADRNGSSAQRGNAGEVRSLSKTQREPELGAALLGRSGCDDQPSPTNGFWRDADWLFCRDERWRPVEPGTFPLAHGAPARVGRLRGYGNAVDAQATAGFIEAYLDIATLEGSAA